MEKMTLEKRESDLWLNAYSTVTGGRAHQHQKLRRAQTQRIIRPSGNVVLQVPQSLTPAGRGSPAGTPNRNSPISSLWQLSAQKLSFAGSEVPTELRVLSSAQSTRTNSPRSTSETITTAAPLTRPARRFADVVAITMLLKNWLSSVQETRARAENKSAASEARQQIHTALVFEPLPVVLEKAASLFGSTSAIFPASASETSRNAAEMPYVSRPSSSNKLRLNADATHSSTDAVNNEEKPKSKPKSVAISNNVEIFHSLPDETNGVDGSALSNIVIRRNVALENSARRFREIRAEMATLAQRFNSGRKKLFELPFQTVDPAKRLYYYWTFIVYVGFLYNSYMCVIFVFDDTIVGTSNFFGYWLTFNLYFDMINAADIFVNSKLTQMEDGMIIRSWLHLAKRYFKSQNFTFDAIAVVPTDLLLLKWPQCSLVRINRLMKVHRVMDFVERTNMRTNYPNGFRIFHIIIICIVLFHWNAALYYKISLMREDYCKNISTMEQMENYSCIKAWEFKYIKIEDPIFATCDILLTDADERCGINETDPDDRAKYVGLLSQYWENKIKPVKFSNFTKQYSLSIYWSSLTLTTSGQQPYPSEALHNLLEIFDTIVGVLVFAVIVGSVGNVVTTMNRGRAEIQQLMDGIKFYMNYRNVSVKIQKRVLDCVGYIQHNGMIQDEKAIMKSIPPRLQGELAVHLHMDTLRRVELLCDCEANLLYELVLRLQLHMFSPNDFLTRCGEVAKEMFIIKNGILESLSPTGELIDTFEEGSAFGELSILKMVGAEHSNHRVRSLRSVGYSEVYILRQEDVLDVLRDYPDAKHSLISKARELIHRRGRSSIEDVGDFLNQETLQEQQILCSQSVEDKLESISLALKGIDSQLNQLYGNFHQESNIMKKRITKLEEIFRDNRETIKEERFQLISKRL